MEDLDRVVIQRLARPLGPDPDQGDRVIVLPMTSCSSIRSVPPEVSADRPSQPSTSATPV
jgi:hypothetical protein